MKLPKKWDLNSIYSGGSHSTDLQKAFDHQTTKLRLLETLLEQKKINASISTFQEIRLHLREIEPFIRCLQAQNIKDTKTAFLDDQIKKLKAHFLNLSNQFDVILSKISDKEFEILLENPQITPIAFGLRERRLLAKERLSPHEEAFITDLAINGYHGWQQMWENLIGNMHFPLDGKKLSLGQIENAVNHPDRKIRKSAFEVIDHSFEKKEDLFAQVLNHLAGFRLETYKKRAWHSILKESLCLNRIEHKTLQTMWHVIQKHQQMFFLYLNHKATLLHLPKLSWHDVEAPIENKEKTIPYEKAVTLIIEAFQPFSPQMANFAHKVLTSHWIDAENRSDKHPGGFCTGFPKSKQSRIFLTYENRLTNFYTLAHEIGHAFHNHVLFTKPELAQQVPMVLAETASTMAEMMVTQATIDKENDPKNRLFLLNDHLSRATSYLLNIYCRFLFEKQFYHERKQGFIPAKSLNAMMIEAQKQAFGTHLEAYHPRFWAAKMHFYLTEMPFYNFPYTFGYLFSLGIFYKASQKNDFESIFIAILQDSGEMSVENLAKKHLNTDLQETSFWENALFLLEKNCKIFLEEAKKIAF